MDEINDDTLKKKTNRYKGGKTLALAARGSPNRPHSYQYRLRYFIIFFKFPHRFIYESKEKIVLTLKGHFLVEV